MSQVAKDAGLTREALYKALRPGVNPRFDTVQCVCAALGVELSVTPGSTRSLGERSSLSRPKRMKLA